MVKFVPDINKYFSRELFLSSVKHSTCHHRLRLGAALSERHSTSNAVSCLAISYISSASHKVFAIFGYVAKVRASKLALEVFSVFGPPDFRLSARDILLQKSFS